MPAALERSLRRGARRAGLRPGGRRWRAYVFGTLAQIKRLTRRKR